jgi:hypothetical protein
MARRTRTRSRTPIADDIPFPMTLLQNIRTTLCGKEVRVLRVVDAVHFDAEVVHTGGNEPSDISSFRLQIGGLSFRKRGPGGDVKRATAAFKPCHKCGLDPRGAPRKAKPLSSSSSSSPTTASSKTGLEMLEQLLSETNTLTVASVQGIKAVGKHNALICGVEDGDGKALVDGLVSLGPSCDGEWKVVRL